MNYPNNPKANNVSITSVSPTLTSLTHSLKRQARRRGGQRWLLEVDYPLMTRAQFAPIWSFSIAQQGQFKTFKYVPPVYNTTSGTAEGDLKAIVNHKTGDSDITLTGISGALYNGDFIKFQNHNKVYMVVDTKTNLGIWTEGICSDSNYVTEDTCIAAQNTWSDGEPSNCSDPAYNDQISCENAINTWTVEDKGVCYIVSSSGAIDYETQQGCNILASSHEPPNFAWVDGKCITTYPYTESSCLVASDAQPFVTYDWLSVGTGSCSDSNYFTEDTCIAAQNTWTDGIASNCSDPAFTDQPSCENAINTWTPTGTCSNPIYTDRASCQESAKTIGITVEPALYDDVSIDEVVTYKDVPFNVAFTKDTTAMSVQVNELVSYKITLAEVV